MRNICFEGLGVGLLDLGFGVHICLVPALLCFFKVGGWGGYDFFVKFFQFFGGVWGDRVFLCLLILILFFKFFLVYNFVLYVLINTIFRGGDDFNVFSIVFGA